MLFENINIKLVKTTWETRQVVWWEQLGRRGRLCGGSSLGDAAGCVVGAAWETRQAVWWEQLIATLVQKKNTCDIISSTNAQLLLRKYFCRM
jgi:hypothetical protein